MPTFRDYRDHIDSILRAIRAAADPAAALTRALDSTRTREPVPVLAIGKAAGPMFAALEAWLGTPAPHSSRVMPPPGADDSGPNREVYTADHPTPTQRSVTAARAVANWLIARRADAAPQRPLVLLLSGGASSLLTLPSDGLSLDDVRAITNALLRAGAPIGSLNTVRKHIDQLKAGRLAQLAAPRPIDAYILSDVIGDRLDVIASGPISPDPTTFTDALAVLDRFACRAAAPAVTAFLEAGARGEHPETPKPGDPLFDTVTTHIIASNTIAVEAAGRAAASVGFHVLKQRTGVTGEASDAGRALARAAQQIHRRGDGPACIVWGGETTVTVGAGTGLGGRNQELALAAAIELDGRDTIALATYATDGVDGPTDAAGAIVTSETTAAARAAGIDLTRALADHDSHPALDRLGSLIRTGPTGANVNDVAVALVYGPKPRQSAPAAPPQCVRS